MDSEKFVARYAKNLFLKELEKAILCFSPGVAKKLQNLYKGKRIYCLGAYWDIYEKNKSVVVSHFGIGVGASLIQFEYLKALKLPLVFSLGAIASFDKKLNLGQKLFIQRAYEETSSSLNSKNTLKQHDKQSNNQSKNKQEISKQIRKKLQEGQIEQSEQIMNELFIKNPHKKTAGQLIKDLSLLPITSLSCDRPYNIQKKNYPLYIAHNISGLEMEASALMSVGKQHKIPVFCMAVVSDFLSEKGWDMGFSHKAFQNSLFALLEKLLFYKLR